VRRPLHLAFSELGVPSPRSFVAYCKVSLLWNIPPIFAKVQSNPLTLLKMIWDESAIAWHCMRVRLHEVRRLLSCISIPPFSGRPALAGRPCRLWDPTSQVRHEASTTKKYFPRGWRIVSSIWIGRPLDLYDWMRACGL